MTIKRVGLIGVGLMGHGIGKNILAKGFALKVMAHRNRGPVDDLIARGASEAATPAEIAADSDLVILCVTGTPQVESIVYGEHGLAFAERRGLIIADCSTAEPHSTIRIAADLAKHGVMFVDTPMTRTPKEAEDGKLGLMVGGAAETVEKIRPVLECFADTIILSSFCSSATEISNLPNVNGLTGPKLRVAVRTKKTQTLTQTQSQSQSQTQAASRTTRRNADHEHH